MNKKLQKAILITISSMLSIGVIATTASLVPVLSKPGYNLDKYGNHVPTSANDLSNYIEWIPNDAGVKGTTAETAHYSLTRANENNQGMFQIQSFLKTKYDYIPTENMNWTFDSQYNPTKPTSLDFIISVLDSDGGRYTWNVEVNGFKDPKDANFENKLVSDPSKSVRDKVIDNILITNNLKHITLQETPDSPLWTQADKNNNDNAIRWGKGFLDKYQLQVFKDEPFANFYYVSTFDNGIQRITVSGQKNGDYNFQWNESVIIEFLKQAIETPSQEQLVEFNNAATRYNTIANKNDDREANVNSESNNNFFKAAAEEIINLETDKAGLANLLKSSINWIKRFENFIKAEYNKAKFTIIKQTILNKLNSINESNIYLTLKNIQENEFSQIRDILIEEKVLFIAQSTKSAEQTAIKNTKDLLYRKEKQIIQNSETKEIVDNGYSAAPLVRVGIQKLISLVQLMSNKEMFKAAGGITAGPNPYAIENTEERNLLKSVIVDIMDDLSQKYYYAGQQQYVNWWHYEIGIPNDMVKLLYILDKAFEPERTSSGSEWIEKKFAQWTSGIDYFLPNPRYGGAAPTAINGYFPVKEPRIQTGANIIDNSKPIIAAGILNNNLAQVDDALLALYDNLFREFVDDGDGFYYDGSYLQHDNLPYIGSYGEQLFKGLAIMWSYFEGTESTNMDGDVVSFDLAKDPRFYNVYEFIEKSLMPFMKDMSISDNFSGRSITRQGHSDKMKGTVILGSISVLAKNAPNGVNGLPDYKSRLDTFIKEQLRNYEEQEIRDISIQAKIPEYQIQNLMTLKRATYPEILKRDLDGKFYEQNFFDEKLEQSSQNTNFENSIIPNETVPVGYDLLKDNNGMVFSKTQDRYVWNYSNPDDSNDSFMYNIALQGNVSGFTESILGENMNSYYLADGATTLHSKTNNPIYSPYENDYWTLLNPEKVAGTSSLRNDEWDSLYDYEFPYQYGTDPSKWDKDDPAQKAAKIEYDNFMQIYNKKNSEIEYELSLKTNDSYSNGIIYEDIGMVKGKIDNYNKRLTTRKTYFMIEDQIMVVGNVESLFNEYEKVNTIIENRRTQGTASITQSEVNGLDQFIFTETKSGAQESIAFQMLPNSAQAESFKDNYSQYPMIAQRNRGFDVSPQKINVEHQGISINHQEKKEFAYSIIPNYITAQQQDYNETLENFNVLINNKDMIFAKYDKKDASGSIISTKYMISMFTEPNQVRWINDNRFTYNDSQFLDKFIKGWTFPELNLKIHTESPLTLIFDQNRAPNSDLKLIVSSDWNLQKYNFQLTSMDDEIITTNSTNKYLGSYGKTIYNKNLYYPENLKDNQEAIKKYQTKDEIIISNSELNKKYSFSINSSWANYISTNHNTWVVIKRKD